MLGWVGASHSRPEGGPGDRKPHRRANVSVRLG
jgi:hypothetical protein